MTEPNAPTVLSAFTGLGGLDLGLEASGFHHLGCIEKDEVTQRSLKLNRGDSWPLLEPGDLTTLASTLEPKCLGVERRELSLLAGGPPCQPFSKAAQWAHTARTGLDDPRSNCLGDFFKLVDTFLPKVVLIENVSGFVQGPVSALGELRAAVREINARNGTTYEPLYKIVDAADCGVPQHRRRVLIVMLRDDDVFIWPDATHADRRVRAWDAIGDLPTPTELPQAVGKWAELLPSIPEGHNYLWHTSRGGGRPLFGYRTRYWSFLLKLAKAKPSWTLPAQPGPSTGPFHWDNRPLTIPEMLALQSFPVTWQVEGDYRSQVRQVGNATPPRLAETIGRAIAQQVFGADLSGVPFRHATERAVHVPRARARAAISPSYEWMLGEHDDHPGVGKGPRPRNSTAMP
jgi:DNA (cytosine-5)-methyltransferase 1